MYESLDRFRRAMPTTIQWPLCHGGSGLWSLLLGLLGRVVFSLLDLCPWDEVAEFLPEAGCCRTTCGSGSPVA